MSDREFENYLTLLAGLLRLSGKQRDAIADELRSHLEDRLEELMAGGVSHDEAVKQALAEFGDAAGLAGQFVAISKNRKRRWLVRLVTFSAAATILIAASLIIFWPGRNAAPGRAAAIAQQQAQPAAKKADPFSPPVAPRPAATNRIEEELAKPTNVDFVEQPLKDVFGYLQEAHQIPIYLKTKKLEEAGVPADKPITMSLRGVSLRTVLDLMLDELELSYLVTDVLIITTPEDEEYHLQTRVYDCRDLLAMPAPPGADKLVPAAAHGSGVSGMGGMFAVADEPVKGSKGGSSGGQGGGMGGFGSGSAKAPQTELEKRTDDLIELITATVKPDSWDDVGGPGSVSAYNGLFAVLQTGKVHTEVEHVLDMLREAAGLDVVKGAKVVR
jgi:hypothetical protein